MQWQLFFVVSVLVHLGLSGVVSRRGEAAPSNALVSIALSETQMLTDEEWGPVRQDAGHTYRAARRPQGSRVRLQAWWGETVRPPAGTRYLIAIRYRDDLGVPTPILAYSGSAGFSGHSELHRIGGLADRQWKQALVPVSWDFLIKLQGTELAELEVAPPEGELPVEQLTLLPIDSDAEQRYNAETRAWVARVQAQRTAPRKEIAAPQQAEIPRAWQTQALVPYARPYTEIIFPYSAPQTSEVGAPLVVRLAQGEYEPVAFGIYANAQELHNVTVEVTFPPGTPPLAPEVRTAEYALVQPSNDTLGTFPQRLWPAYPVDISAGQSHWFWVTLKADPYTATPGTYQGKVNITAQEATAALDLKVEILPFRLLTMPEIGLRMGGCTRGLVPAHELDVLREHNFNMMNIWFPSVTPAMRKEGDTVALDFYLLDDWMASAKARGMEAMVWFLGGDPAKYPKTFALERELYGVMYGAVEPYFEMVSKDKGKMPAVVKPLYEQWIHEVWQHAKARDWPELIFTPFDEPAKWARSEENSGPWIRTHFEEACALIRQAAPGVKVYGSIHHAHGMVFLPILDIFCTNAVEEDPQLGDKVRQAGKAFWQYTGGGNDAGHPAQGRYDFGFFFSAYNSRGNLVWAYNWGARFDTSRGNNWLFAWNTPFDVIPAPYYEGVREGLDDRRYVETLKRLAQARGMDISAFLEELDTEVRKFASASNADNARNFWTQVGGSRMLQAWRQRVIEQILALR